MIPPRKKPTIRQMLAPADATEARRQGQGIGDIEAIGQMARTVVPEVLRNAPGTSVPMAGYDAAQAARRGNMGEAALAALGAIPLAGAMRYADEAGDLAKAAVRAGKEPQGILAWHGSPYKGIEKTGFDLAKAGTGEGGQYYGHGIYFAERQPVAQWYRDTYAAKRNQPGGLYQVELQARPSEILNLEKTLGEQDPAVLEAANAALRSLQKPLEKRSKKELAAMIQRMDPDGDWESAYRSLSKEDYLEAAKEFDLQGYISEAAFPTTTGGAINEQLITAAGGGLSRNNNPSQVLASQAFKNAGIVGLKYPDRASRMMTRPVEGSNYVMFSPERIKILQALGVAGMLGAGARSTKPEER